MKVTLIVTTYNWPEALEVCLLSVINQSVLPDEVIVADDGSTEETARLIEKLAGFSVLPIIHSWQSDQGFRAAKSRNNAIAKASGAYIIMIDGDIVLHKDFVKDHLAAARKGFFIQGSRVILKEKKTKEIISSGDATIYFFSQGLENRKNSIRSSFMAKIFSRKYNLLDGIRACNFSFWKSDALEINGFNEDFEGWGREDSEFACRLINNGVNRYNLKFMAVAFHLFHPVCTRENLNNNDSILEQTEQKRLSWCRNGLRKIGDTLS